MEAKLNVEIGAEIQKLNSGFAQAIKTVESGSARMDSEVKKASKSITSTLTATDIAFMKSAKSANTFAASQTAALAKVASQSASSGQSMKATGASLYGLTSAMKQASLGPSAISDALQGLVGDLSEVNRVSKETGQSIGKTLTGSLVGGGLTLALHLAVVGAALLVREFIKTKDAAKAAADQYKLYNDAIKSGNQEAGKQLADLDALYKATTNVANSQETRNKAAKEVIELSNGVFKASDLEKLKNGELGEAYKSLTADIIANARAKALQEKIAGLTGQKLDAEIKLQKIANANSNESARAKDARQEIGLGQAVVYTKEQQIAASNGRAEAATKETKAVIDGLEKQMAFLSKMQGSDKNIVDAIAPGDKAPKVPKEKKSDVTKYLREDLLKGRVGLQDMLGRINLDLDDFVLDYKKTESELSKTPLLPVEAFKIQAKIFTEDFDRFNAQLNLLANDLIDGSLSGLGSAIGNAMANGTSIFEAGGKALLGSFGGFLTEYGKLLIKYGAAAVLKGKLDLAALVPGAGIPAGILAIAAGVALVAAGAAISNFAGGKSKSDAGGSSAPRKIPGFANGVNDFAGGLAMVGERGPELVNLPTGANVIPNHNLSSFGGGDIVFNVSSRIDQLGNLITAIDRERSRLKRVGS